jgi:hypothetical protein
LGSGESPWISESDGVVGKGRDVLDQLESVNNGGRVGRVKGIEESEGDCSQENDGVMGDSVGVLRRTYDDIGVLAASSVVES